MAVKKAAGVLGMIVAFMVVASMQSTAAAESAFIAPKNAKVENTEVGPDVLTAAGIDTECSDGEYTGYLLSPHTFELKPNIHECITKAFAGLPAKYILEGCVYLVHPTKQVSGQQAWLATVDLSCPPEYTQRWLTYETEARFEGGQALCTIGMPSQKGLGGAEIRNVSGAKDKIEIQWNFRKFEYSAFGSALFCGLPYGTVSHDASYKGSVIVSVTDSFGKPASVRIGG
jgi:hypothetical protein